MLIKQYAYFYLVSEQMTAAEMTARLGVEPDEVLVRGARQAEPPRPATHKWMVTCREAGMMVDEQIAQVIDRLSEHATAIGELAAELCRMEGGPFSSVLQVVRVLEHPDGDQEDPSSLVDGWQKLPGQHQALGWRLDARVLDFLRITHAELDVDEYAYG